MARNNNINNSFDFEARARNAQKLMQREGLDALYVTSGPNMTYFSGFSTYEAGWPIWLSVLLLPSEGDPLFLMNEMHRDIFHHKSSWIADVRTHKDGGDVVSEIREAIEDKGLSRAKIGVEGKFWFGDLELVNAAAPAAQLRSANSLFDELRRRKEPSEIQMIRQSCRASVAGFRRALEVVAPGSDTRNAAAEIASAMLDEGAENVSDVFGMITKRFGPEFKSGEILPLDIGSSYMGYASDCARTIFVGSLDDRLRRIYEILLDARSAVLDKVRPGALCSDLHRTAAEEVRRTGYEQVWRIGHGIGLSPNHESPLLQAGNDLLLEPGMVFVIDPGVHIEGYGIDMPVAIEDVFLVVEGGYEWMTDFDVGPLLATASL